MRWLAKGSLKKILMKMLKLLLTRKWKSLLVSKQRKPLDTSSRKFITAGDMKSEEEGSNPVMADK